MSRITKQIAEEMAKHLVEPQTLEITKLTGELTTVCRQFYLDSLPEGILPVFKKWLVWFDSTSQIRIEGPGLSQGYKYYNIGESLPKNTDSIVITAEQAADIIAIEKEERSQLRESIEVILFNLRTYKNVQEKFPEAAKYLPAQKTPAPVMILLKDIRCKLDKVNC